MRFELRLLGPITLVCFADFRYGSNCHLSGQAELVPDFTVDFFLKPHLVRGSQPVRSGRDEVARLIEAFHRAQKHLELLLSGFQAYKKRLPQRHEAPLGSVLFNAPFKGSAIPPTNQFVGFLAVFW